MATHDSTPMQHGSHDAPPVTLDLGVSPALEDIVRGLADLKLALDRFSRDDTGQPFINDWFDSRTGTCAFTGHAFLQQIVPFLDHSEAMGSSFRAYVDPALVLGASIKGRPESIRGEEIAQRRARYARDFDVSGLYRAEYDWLESLGIVWAHEGKHRVAFMRAHGEPAIAAWVQRRSYPTPDRIVLVEPTEYRQAWFAILDGRYLQLVPRPAITQRLLSAYGVETIRWRDLDDVPSELFVRHAIVDWQQRPQSYCAEDRMLDLPALRDEECRARELVSRTFAELELEREGWKVQYGRQFAYALLVIAVGLLLKIVFRAAAMQDLGFVLVGAGVGLGCVISTLRVVGPRGRGRRDVG
ncbi:hypothetical protein [Azonexus sp.]|jgi:hypothetical protein|uniref:hypothetical protein n=1 Tax=Azonexus sp. TaxID=1872668 RepID=UPI002829E3EF|nr:hypothetical protein [Azonexus sp.]MDR1994205.1 hypothetical protein [Azonexus sp.]